MSRSAVPGADNRTVSQATPISLPLYSSASEYFAYLQSLLVHAYEHRPNESALYPAYGNIISTFSSSASVAARKEVHHRLYLAYMPVREIIIEVPSVDKDGNRKEGKTNRRRSPDIISMITHGLPLLPGPSVQGSQAVFLVEIKAGPLSEEAVWYSETPDLLLVSPRLHHIMVHFPQIAEQAKYAREGHRNSSPIFVFLIIDIWFSLFRFTEEPPLLPEIGVQELHKIPANIQAAHNKYCVYSNYPIFNDAWSAFSPKFLMALQMVCDANQDYIITPHAFFQPPAGTPLPEESPSVMAGAAAFNAALESERTEKERNIRVAGNMRLPGDASTSEDPASDHKDTTFRPGRKVEPPKFDKTLRPGKDRTLGVEAAAPIPAALNNPAAGPSHARRLSNSDEELIRSFEKRSRGRKKQGVAHRAGTVNDTNDEVTQGHADDEAEFVAGRSTRRSATETGVAETGTSKEGAQRKGKGKGKGKERAR